MTDNLLRVKEFYDRQVKEHPDNPAMLGCDSLLSREIRTVQEDRLIEEIYTVFPRNRKFRILELGCGAGRWLEYFNPYSLGMTGVDFSPAAIELARNKQIPGAAFVCSGIEEFEPNGKYDLIYFSSVLQYLANHQMWHILEKYRDFLTPDGLFIIRDTFHKVPADRYLPAGYLTHYRVENDMKITLLVMDMIPFKSFQAFYYPWIPAFILNNPWVNQTYGKVPNRKLWLSRLIPLLVKSWQDLPGHRFIFARKRS